MDNPHQNTVVKYQTHLIADEVGSNESISPILR